MKVLLNIIIMSVIAIPLSAQDDITPPELTQLSLSPNIVDVTEGSAAFSVTAGATDNLSGLDRFYVWFYSPSTEQEIYGWVDFEEGSTEDTATNDFIIEQYAESGDWEINTLIVEDVAGNDVQYYTTDLVSMGFETTFTVNSQVCTASDGTDGVTLWGECYSIENTTSLNLNNSGLNGAIPPEIGYLTNLTSINLSWNELTGPIPAEIWTLTNLLYLHLYMNQLSGTIPPEIGNLTNLTALGLRTNQLTGTIPPELWTLTNLTYLNLGDNQLTNPIPASIGNLTNLTYLGLYENPLTGQIPVEIGSLTNLYHLYLYDNQLTGQIPSEIWTLMNLENLGLNNNQLTGSIPSEIENLTNLFYLSLEYNELSGQIPESICNLTLINFSYTDYFIINNNQFCPPYPECIEDYVGTQDISNCGPSTWYVSTTGSDDNDGSAEYPFQNIQFALETAESYDTVLVYPGIYYEFVKVWQGKVLKSLDGPEYTVIDGSNIMEEHYVVWLAGTIDGFTINNSPNRGITNDASGSIFKNLIIENNQGRGIYAYWTSDLIIENVIIRNNGGGMEIDSDVTINADNLEIYDNVADYGGGIYVGQGSFYLDHALIYNNHANINGGGMYICCADADFPHLTIVENTSSGTEGVHVNSSGYGDGIHFYNTIVWDNDLLADNENYIYAYYSIVEDWDWDHCSTECIGNNNTEPYFCDETNGDYTVSESSNAATQGALCNYDDWFFYNDSYYYNTCEGFWYGANTGGYIGALGPGCEEILSTSHGVEIPEAYALSQNYPNPFNPFTTILYEILETGTVELSVYSLNGQLIETLVNNITVPGYYSTTWNGDKVSSGLYMYRLISGGKTITRRMLLMK